MNKLYVLSLGGSLITPDTVDIKFLKSFKELIVKRVKAGDRFIIVTGGGSLARKYINDLKLITKVAPQEYDWVGIYATRLNAKLVQSLFGTLAHKAIVEDPSKKVNFSSKVLLAGGWKPGRSSDDVAVRMAFLYGAGTVINLSNIDYVYNKDPRKFKNAKAIKEMSWKDYKKMIGGKWSPGKHVPFDPIASSTAAHHKQKVIIVNGKKLANLKKLLEGQNFLGTVIS